MERKHVLTSDQIKKIHQLENMALMLDKAIKLGEISDEDIDKAQTILSKLDRILVDDNNSIGSKAYIVYETQALIFWIQDNKDEARDFLKVAVDTKGDDSMFTESANDMLDLFDDGVKKTNTKKLPTQDKRFVGVHGWLTYISAGIVLSALFAVYNIYAVISVASQYNGTGFEWAVPFEVVANLIIIILTVYYIVNLNKLSKSTKLFAIIIEICWVVFSIIDASIVSSVYSSTNQIAPSDTWSNVGRSIFVACIWIPYFLVSKRVKQTLVK